MGSKQLVITHSLENLHTLVCRLINRHESDAVIEDAKEMYASIIRQLLQAGFSAHEYIEKKDSLLHWAFRSDLKALC